MTKSTHLISSLGAVLLMAVATDVTGATTFNWDNATGNYKVADSNNWYVTGTSTTRQEITADDALASDGAYHYLDSGTFEVYDALFGRNSSTPSTLDISNGTFKVANHLNLGRYGQNTALNMYGGRIEAKQLSVGNWSSYNSNTMTVYGGEVLVTGGNWPAAITLGLQNESRGDLIIRGGTVTACNTVDIGFSNLQNQGGPSEDFCSSVTVAGGSLSVTGAVYVANADGENYGGGGRLVQTGGEIYISGNLCVAYSTNGWARVDVTGGKMTVAGIAYVGDKDYAQPAVLSIANGADVTMGTLSPGRYSDGSVYLSDATLTVSKFYKVEGAAGTARFYADNGTLVLTSSFASTLGNLETIEVVAGGLVVDTGANSPTIPIAKAMTGVGDFTKRGSGALTISGGDYSVHGKIVVAAGTLKMPANQTIYCTGTEVADGATLDLNGSKVVVLDATKRVPTAVWTDASGDHDPANANNWSSTVEFLKDGVVIEDLTTTLCVLPDANTAVKVPYAADLPDFSGVTCKSLVYVFSGEMSLPRGTLVPDIVRSAIAWYDPSDQSTLTINDDGTVNGIANKGTLGSALDMRPIGTATAPITMPTTGNPGGWQRDGIAFTINAITNRGFMTAVATQLAGDRTVIGVDRRVDDSEWYPFLTMSDTFYGWVGAAELWGSKFRYYVDGGDTWGYSLNPSGAPTTQDEDTIRSIRVKSTGLTAELYYASSGLSYSAVTNPVPNLVAENMHLYMGERNFWNGSAKSGYVGESLAFGSSLSDADLENVRQYLNARWFTDPVTLPGNILLEDGTALDMNYQTWEITGLAGSGTIFNGDLTAIGTLHVTVKADGTIDPVTLAGVDFDASTIAKIDVTGADNVKAGAKLPMLAVSGATLSGKFAGKITVDGRLTAKEFQVSVNDGALLLQLRPSIFVIYR